MAAEYTEDSIRSLDWKEHIRLRPGMYIGKLGDGSQPDDGIYILLKEVLDNSIDEFVMGVGKTIEVTIGNAGALSLGEGLRDHGGSRGIGGHHQQQRGQGRLGGRADARQRDGRDDAVRRLLAAQPGGSACGAQPGLF